MNQDSDSLSNPESLISLLNSELNAVEYDIPEKILAERPATADGPPLLVKWKNVPAVRATWEHCWVLTSNTEINAAWEREKQKQEAGLSRPFDLKAFVTHLNAIDQAEKQRRNLRRLKWHVTLEFARIS